MSFVILTILLLCVTYCLAQYQVLTIPEPEKETGRVVMAIEKGQINVTIVCSVTYGGNPYQTEWYIKRKVETNFAPIEITNRIISNPEGLGSKLILTGDPIPGLNWKYAFDSNITIVNFTDEFDKTEFLCGPYSKRKSIVVGFPVPPTVNDNMKKQMVMENTNTTISLQIPEAANPFPETISFHWMFNEENITNSDNVVTDGYNLTILNAQKTMSGKYTLTVSNSFSMDKGSFLLDVQIPHPHSVIAANITHSSVHLLWSAPDEHDYLYHVVLTTNSSFSDSIIPINTTMLSVNGLLCNTNYTATIMLVGKLVNGNMISMSGGKSNPISFYTTADEHTTDDELPTVSIINTLQTSTTVYSSSVSQTVNMPTQSSLYKTHKTMANLYMKATIIVGVLLVLCFGLGIIIALVALMVVRKRQKDIQEVSVTENIVYGIFEHQNTKKNISYNVVII